MIRRTLIFVALIFACALPASAVSLSDVELPQQVEAGGSTLQLNGWGVRKKFFLKLYVGALYLPQPTSDAMKILESDSPIAIRLHILSKLVSAKRMEKAIKEGFERSAPQELNRLKPQIDQFLAFFRDNVSEDDVFDIVYLPGKGVKVRLNGRELGIVAGNGRPFRKALFGIWLGQDPVQANLKDALLGVRGE